MKLQSKMVQKMLILQTDQVLKKQTDLNLKTIKTLFLENLEHLDLQLRPKWKVFIAFSAMKLLFNLQFLDAKKVQILSYFNLLSIRVLCSATTGPHAIFVMELILQLIVL